MTTAADASDARAVPTALPEDGARMSASALRAWRTFLRAHALVTRSLEIDLQTRSGLTLADYDVLVQLEEAEDGALRMHQLADRVVLSRGGLTRLVDRLEAEGLVERRRCKDDARGFLAVLSPAGHERLRAAAPAHLAAVQEFFTNAYSDSELSNLAELLQRAVRPVAPRCSATD